MRGIIFTYFILTFLFAEFSSAQTNNPALEHLLEIEEGKLSGRQYINKSTFYEGTPLIFEEWGKAVITLKNKKTVEVNQINFDAFRDAFVYVHPKSKQWIEIDHEFISDVLVELPNQQKLDFKLFALESDTSSRTYSHLQEIYNGSLGFYKKYTSKMVPLPSQEANKYLMYKFVNEVDYYVYREQEFRQVKLQKLVLISMFPEHKKAIKTYLRKQKAKAKTETGFLEALQYIDEELLTKSSE